MQVSVSRVKWVMPLGITGMTPLAAFGPVSMGPSHSGAERSSLDAPHVTVFVDALQSLLQRKAVLRLLLIRPQARSSCIMPSIICISVGRGQAVHHSVR